MKTIEDAIFDAMQELVQRNDFEVAAHGVIVAVLKKHINPLLTPPPDAAALRKAEVARIAEGLFIAACGFDKDRDIATNTLAQNAFKDAEDFVSYKESQ
jgi:hypothetical protein